MLSLPFLVPWHPLPIPSFYGEWLALALGLLVLAFAGAARRTAPVLHIPAVALAPLALVLVLLLQLALGLPGHPVNALAPIAFLVWSALVAIAARSMAADDPAQLMPTLAWWLLGGGLAGAAAGLIQYAGLAGMSGGLVMAPRPLELYGVFGNLGQQNHFSTHLALALAALAYLHALKRLPTAHALGAAALLATAMALSGSRSIVLHGGWLAIVWLLARRAPGRPLVGRRALLLVVLAAVALGALLLAARHAQLPPQLARLLLYAEGAGPRMFYWQHALAMAAEQPLLGVGIDRFATALIAQLQDGDKVFAIDQSAHNLALQLLATTGLAGFAALALPLALFVRRLARTGLRPDTMLPAGVLGVLFIHSMLEHPLHYAYFLGAAALFAGAADPRAWRLELAPRLRLAIGTLCLAALAALALTAVDFDTLHRHFYAAGSGDIRDARHAEILRTLRARSAFAPNAELISPEAFLAPDAGVPEQLAFNARLRQFAPIAHVEYRHALLLAQSGQLDAAKAQFVVAARAYPDEARAFAHQLVLVAASDANVGKLAVFALDVVQKKEGSP